MRIALTMAEVDAAAASSDMLLLYFSGENCGVCRDLRPKVEEMLLKFPDIQAVEIETAKSPALSASFEIFSVPALILLVQGKQTVRMAGVFSLRELEAKVERYHRLFTSSGEA